ncbi:calcium-binding protein [Leptolyngbya sp. FACHB-541]|uniref:calcium-binding protein n=1 Tax=Leptolyngbya sp. FACHB-541 TaxID=2692810 RepID=UPI001685BAA8|nr:calcium-binding protein [Leptolyngbya sp. FACHB-541]MBD1995519.1 calcium-binding protein [Leptolyngbya sp. FACHB-541]
MTIKGTNNGETIIGTDLADVILAYGGNDTVYAKGGNDIVRGGKGNDKIYGGDGKDALYGEYGNDVVVGNRGDDKMYGQAGNDVLVWNNGDGSDLMNGGIGYDVIQVNGARDQGDEFTLKAQGGKAIFDRVNLVPFTLTVDEAEAFHINGLGGNDSLDVDSLTGTDVKLVKFSGGDGYDKLDASDSETKVIAYGDAGNDLLIGSGVHDYLYGGKGHDVVVGDRGNDRMYGQQGNDRLVWNNGDGSDLMDGGVGYDVIEVNGARQQGDEFTLKAEGGKAIFDRINLVPFTLTVDNAEAFKVSGLGGDDSFVVDDLTGTDVRSVRFYGGEGNDTFDGKNTKTPLTLYGDAGDDTLTGGKYHDTIKGGDGKDWLTGGGGADKFVYDNPFQGIDTITDFVAGKDTIVVSAAGFRGGLVANTVLAASQFTLGSSAGDASDRFIYNNTTGALYWDLDGTGAVGQIKLATLSGKPALNYTDISVVA